MQKLIIKNIVQMSAAESQLIKESWKSTMRKKPLKVVLLENAKLALDCLVDTTQKTSVLNV